MAQGWRTVSTLANFIRAKLEARGWTQSDLAAEAGIPKTTLTGIFNNPQHIPELPTYVKLSIALEVPLRDLLQASGFDVESRDGVNDTQARLAVLVEAMPWLSQMVDALASIHPDDQASVIAFLDLLAQQRKQNRKG